MAHFRIPPSIRDLVPLSSRRGYTDACMADWRMELLTGAYTEQLNDFCNIQYNKKCQREVSRPHKPLESKDALAIPQATCGECFSSHCTALNLLDDDSTQCREDCTCYSSLIVSKDIGNCLQTKRAGSSSSYFCNQLQDSMTIVNTSQIICPSTISRTRVMWQNFTKL